MKLVATDRVKAYVLNHHEPVCISIYLPLGQSEESRSDAPRRLAKLVSHVEEKLAGTHPGLVQWYMAPLRSLLSQFPTSLDGKTLALFRSRRVAVMTVLPTMESESTTIADTFHVKPMLSVLQPDIQTTPPRRGDLVRRLRKAMQRGLLRTDLRDIARDALLGRIKSLWIRRGVSVPGSIDRANGAVSIASARGNRFHDDVIDDIAEIVIAKGGTASIDHNAALADVASGAPVVAVLRRAY